MARYLFLAILALSARAVAQPEHVVLISIDGLAAYELDYEDVELPNLREPIDNGVWAESSETVPSSVERAWIWQREAFTLARTVWLAQPPFGVARWRLETADCRATQDHVELGSDSGIAVGIRTSFHEPPDVVRFDISRSSHGPALVEHVAAAVLGALEPDPFLRWSRF